MPTYEIVCSSYTDTEMAQAVRSFLSVAVSEDVRASSGRGYIPIPDEFREKLTTAISRDRLI